MPILLTLISRSYCHLCHEMEKELQVLAGSLSFQLEILDVDAEQDLEALYGDLVPVLLHEKRELCHYFLDAAKVRDYLSEIG